MKKSQIAKHTNSILGVLPWSNQLDIFFTKVASDGGVLSLTYEFLA